MNLRAPHHVPLPPPRNRPARRGTVLIVTMSILFIIASMVLVFCRSMRVEAVASGNHVASVQAAAVERGAEQYVLALLEQQKETILSVPESSFEAVQVGEGYFWVIRPDFGDDTLPLYGLVDEASKINLNSASEDLLLGLPGMTEDVAYSIIDWRDEDSDVSADGAENEYYLSLTDPYYCKNAPFETLEEVLLVRGVTRDLFYGLGASDGTTNADAARNAGRTVLGSQDAGSRWTTTTDPALARGIADYLTVHSREAGQSGGQQRVNVNDRDSRNDLVNVLNEALNNPGRVAGIVDSIRRQRFDNVFAFFAAARLTAEEVDAIAGRVTTGQSLPGGGGLVNINTAPRDVLLSLPGLDENDVETILARRTSTEAETGGVGWVVEALAGKLDAVGGLITGESSMYSADIVAVSGNGRAYRRVRIVIDARETTPRIVYRRDLTDRGWPMDPQVLADLRAGAGVTYGTRPGLGGGF